MEATSSASCFEVSGDVGVVRDQDRGSVRSRPWDLEGHDLVDHDPGFVRGLGGETPEGEIGERDRCR